MAGYLGKVAVLSAAFWLAVTGIVSGGLPHFGAAAALTAASVLLAGVRRYYRSGPWNSPPGQAAYTETEGNPMAGYLGKVAVLFAAFWLAVTGIVSGGLPHFGAAAALTAASVLLAGVRRYYRSSP